VQTTSEIDTQIPAEMYPCGWSELVSEKKVGQNAAWRVFDVSGNVIGYAR
jgi:hypothetical protein